MASTAAASPSPLRRISLPQWIVIAMVVGVAVGWAWPESARDANGWAATDLRVFSQVFLRLIKSLIVPLIFSTIVVGIAGHGGDLRGTGRLALRAIVLFTVITALALGIGWAAAAIVRPGDGVTLGAASAEEGVKLAERQVTVSGLLEQSVPQSIFEAGANNLVLQVLVFSLLFAVALLQAPEGPRRVMLGVCEALAEVMFRFTALVMLYAPIGIGAAIAVTVSRSGLGVLRNLGVLVLTLYGALAVFIVGVLLPLALLARVPLRAFWRAAREPSLIAFSAASSDAALPRAIQNMERFGVPRRIASFVLPTALSFNLTGSTLFVALASLFVAQAAGIQLSVVQQVGMMATLMLTTKGIAAVPRASLVILSATLANFGLPLQGVAVVLAVDALMDMARTGTNMLSHCLAATVLARWEGDFGKELPGASEFEAADALVSGAPRAPTPAGN